MEAQTEMNNGGGGESINGGGFLASCWLRLASAADGLRCSVAGFAGRLAGIAREDPRRVVHSLKFALALTLVSVLYYITPVFDGFGQSSTIWAVFTVVFIMEPTIGGTVGKGLNRTVGTLVAAALGVGAHQVADLCGHKGELILLSVLVFSTASAATFSRFIPGVKARYEYGVVVFILTFSLVAVSSYRVEDLIQLAQQRFTTIATGVAICLFTNIFVLPVWAGEDLHELAAGNLDNLAEFLEGMGSEYLGENSSTENLEGKAFFKAYKSVLNSKPRENTLCTLAKWEPGHGKFSFRHPWSQYQKLGALSRQCASSMEALASYLMTRTKSQYPKADPGLCLNVQTACAEMTLHSAKALRELSSAVRTMTTPSPTNNDMSAAIEAANRLRSELSNDAAALLHVMHMAVNASLLSDMVTQITKIAESVENLARCAHFKSPHKARVGVAINVVG
ncbi:hypothetical protein ACP4OV_020498 [Aristida adscensionis]